jgi:hypothetical protein
LHPTSKWSVTASKKVSSTRGERLVPLIAFIMVAREREAGMLSIRVLLAVTDSRKSVVVEPYEFVVWLPVR